MGINDTQGGLSGSGDARRCEVAQATRHPFIPAGPHRVKFRHGINAETYRQVHLPDVPMSMLAQMSVGKDRPETHVDQWLVTLRILREYETRTLTRADSDFVEDVPWPTMPDP